MDIYVLRHGDAEEPGRKRDADRSLTERGIKKMKKIAKAMQRMELSFDAILTSPYNRAKETADIVGEALECSSIIKLTPNLVSDANPSALINELNEDYAHRKNILLVSHEPLLSELVAVLISGKRDISVKMKKGGLARLSVDSLHFGKCASLEWLMGPSQFYD